MAGAFHFRMAVVAAILFRKFEEIVVEFPVVPCPGAVLPGLHLQNGSHAKALGVKYGEVTIVQVWRGHNSTSEHVQCLSFTTE